MNEPSPSGLRIRLALVYLPFLAFCGLVTLRLIHLQVLTNPELDTLAQRQFQKAGNSAPFRLPIYDRNGEELAVSIPASSVFARPKLVRNKRRASKVLSTILGGPPARWMAKLDSPRPFVWLHRQLSAETARLLSSKNLSGIYIEPENKRIYPNGSLAAHLIGFTDIDGNGLAGLELSLNRELLQEETKFALLRDGRGTPSYLDKRYAKRGGENKGVYVTIDRRLQHAVEEELEKAMQETGARAVLAAVMDPSTGEIFAMGQRPSFDPNRVMQFPAASLANRFISHLYEPGSTMKVIFAGEALQNGLFRRDSPVDCEAGKITFGKKTIREAESNHKFGILPFEKVIRYSSNVGAVRIAQALGADRVRAALEKYGFTGRTGISLPSEASSGPRPDEFWTPIHLATVGFGQGISATPLQVMTAFAAFANGGYLIRPKILVDENVVKNEDHLDIRRVISTSTARAMRDILISVTEDGTGALAKVEGIRVAGKTGTAQKYEPGIGYGGGKYFSSFVGFLPAEKPELLIAVMVDEPKNGFYASKVAAPLFKKIAERSLQILDRYPKLAAVSPIRVPGVAWSDPIPIPTIEEVSEGKWKMPDLKGVSVREALQLIGTRADEVRLSGSGYVETQSPQAGSVLSAKSRIQLHFSPAG